MRLARVLGNNCKLLLNQKNISKKTFADEMGYSEFDVEKLLDGRLFTTESDIKDIADFFNITEEALYEDKGTASYVGDGFIHYMGCFKNKENEEMILDFLDLYCDLKECLNK